MRQEPYDWDIDKDGLFFSWWKPKEFKKNEIDDSLKRLFGKNWNKPFKKGQKIVCIKQ